MTIWLQPEQRGGRGDSQLHGTAGGNSNVSPYTRMDIVTEFFVSGPLQ
jgi:hypothetical protein